MNISKNTTPKLQPRKIKFPEEYYEHDDVENLSYHCVKDL